MVLLVQNELSRYASGGYLNASVTSRWAWRGEHALFERHLVFNWENDKNETFFLSSLYMPVADPSFSQVKHPALALALCHTHLHSTIQEGPHPPLNFIPESPFFPHTNMYLQTYFIFLYSTSSKGIYVAIILHGGENKDRIRTSVCQNLRIRCANSCRSEMHSCPFRHICEEKESRIRLYSPWSSCWPWSRQSYPDVCIAAATWPCRSWIISRDMPISLIVLTVQELSTRCKCHLQNHIMGP